MSDIHGTRYLNEAFNKHVLSTGVEAFLKVILK